MRTQTAHDEVAELGEYGISRNMPVFVVDFLEKIKIHEQQAQRMLVADRSLNLLINGCLEMCAVEEPRDGVAHRHLVHGLVVADFVSIADHFEYGFSDLHQVSGIENGRTARPSVDFKTVGAAHILDFEFAFVEK